MKKLRKSSRKHTSLQYLIAGGCLLGTAATAQESAQNEPVIQENQKTEADYRNWFEISAGSAFIDGDNAAFKRRHGLPDKPFGGVEEFHYEQDVGRQGLLQVDGRGIFGNEDYAFKISLDHPEIGYFRAGYREFRTYYDLSGGYLPFNDQWFQPSNTELHVDRSEAWIEAGLTLPNLPILGFRYTYLNREGRKNSTIWGDTNLTGGRGARAIVPSYWDLDEDRHIFELSAQHAIGETTFGSAVRYELADQDNSKNLLRRPGEAAERYVTQREDMDVDLFHVRAFQETWFTEEVLFTTGYSYTTMDTDIGGSRIYGADYEPVYDPLFARRQQRDEGFLNLSGGAQLKQHVGNINFMLMPWENVTIVPAVRIESQEQDGIAHFTETNVEGAALTSTTHDLINTRDRGILDVSESLEVRYTGLTNWVLYVRGEWLQGEGDLTEREMELDGTVDLFRETDSTRFTQKYVTGANWYPHRRVSLAGQYYYKTRANDYDHIADSTSNDPTSGNRYPAYIRDQDFQTHDVNFRVTLRPVQNVTLVSRYDFQLSTIDNRMDNLAMVEGAESTAHIFSQSITWVPWHRLYLQGSVNYVVDETETPAVWQVPGTNLVQTAENSYWNVTAGAGLVLTPKTDLHTQYYYYRADNYEDNSFYSVPYGAGAKEHSVTATLVHRFSAWMQGTLKYGFFTGDDETSGGHNDYTAHLAYTSLRFRF